MNRIESKFAEIRDAGRKVLVPFVTAGDPSLEATVPVMHSLVAAGADVLELGVPFSDPMADGPSIQRSSERASSRGGGLRHTLEAVAAFRRDDAETPVVLMGYLNPVEIRGAGVPRRSPPTRRAPASTACCASTCRRRKPRRTATRSMPPASR